MGPFKDNDFRLKYGINDSNRISLKEEDIVNNGVKFTILLIIFFVLISCAQTQEITKTKTAKGAGIGAAAGAATGTIIGSMAGQAGKGAVIGGLPVQLWVPP